jgi:hypothetical protein
MDIPISVNLPPSNKTPSPSRGGSGWGWVLPAAKHPIPLLTSSLKGEERGKLKISVNQDGHKAAQKLPDARRLKAEE